MTSDFHIKNLKTKRCLSSSDYFISLSASFFIVFGGVFILGLLWTFLPLLARRLLLSLICSSLLDTIHYLGIYTHLFNSHILQRHSSESFHHFYHKLISNRTSIYVLFLPPSFNLHRLIHFSQSILELNSHISLRRIYSLFWQPLLCFTNSFKLNNRTGSVLPIKDQIYTSTIKMRH